MFILSEYHFTNGSNDLFKVIQMGTGIKLCWLFNFCSILVKCYFINTLLKLVTILLTALTYLGLLTYLLYKDKVFITVSCIPFLTSHFHSFWLKFIFKLELCRCLIISLFHFNYCVLLWMMCTFLSKFLREN